MSRQPGLVVLATLAILNLGRVHSAEPLPPGTHDRVTVANPTRLDWVFALSNQSPAKPPAEWTKGYVSTEQTYRLVVPAKVTTKLVPLVLFISPGDNPSGF